jgi:serine/threonine-protein kinase
VIVLKLELLPATVSLAGAPPNAQYTCAAIGLSGFAGGGPKTVTLPDVTWSGDCLFTPPTQDAAPRSIRVMLRAGETNTISWPAN